MLCVLMLSLTVSAKLVQTKTFLCKEKYETSHCTIANVTAQDDSIVLKPLYPKMITSLKIQNSSMDFIPTISSIHSINLNYLRCDRLTNITKNSFAPHRNLKKLEIFYGSFSKLEKNLFSQISLLTELHGSYGSISEIDDDAFSNLTNLLQLVLSNNNISKITPKMFSPLDSLLALDLSFNRITCLVEGLFINNINLTYLNLNSNKINQMATRIFNPHSVLSIVDLTENELTTLYTHNMERVHATHNRIRQIFISRSVQYVDVYRNRIENVVCDETGSSQLMYLDMVNNSLTELGCIGSLRKLHTLYLSFNNFGMLKQSSFAALTELSTLSLRSANISMLENVVFTHQNKLQNLDISDNRMGNKAMQTLPAWRNLQFLNVEGNNMTEFPYDILKTELPRLYSIRIGDNDFNCTYLELAIKKLNGDKIEALPAVAYRMRHKNNIAGIGCEEKGSNGTVTEPSN